MQQFTGITDMAQLAIAARALDEHCRETGVRKGSLKHELLAKRTMVLFTRGIKTVDELKRGLRALDNPQQDNPGRAH
jgi:hypothetical protein